MISVNRNYHAGRWPSLPSRGSLGTQEHGAVGQRHQGHGMWEAVWDMTQLRLSSEVVAKSAGYYLTSLLARTLIKCRHRYDTLLGHHPGTVVGVRLLRLSLLMLMRVHCCTITSDTAEPTLPPSSLSGYSFPVSARQYNSINNPWLLDASSL